MLESLVAWVQQLMTLSFWEALFAQFQYLGPAVPIALAAIESLIPALPLVGIVVLNVAAHGMMLGLLYTWIGASIGSTIVFLFFRHVVRRFFRPLAARYKALQRARDWVDGFNPAALFILAIFPFTPSSFLNIAFGVSEFSAKKYLCTMLCAKFVMISLLSLFGQSFVAAFENPLFIGVSIALLVAFYWGSKKMNEKHGL